MLMKKKAVMRDIASAALLVRELNELLKPLQHHVAMGGGVVNNGFSTKDLGLYVLPFNDVALPKQAEVLNALEQMLSYDSPIGDPSYGAPKALSQRDRWSYDGKRVDVFVVKPETVVGADEV